MRKKTIDVVEAEAELVKGKRILRAEKKKAKKLKGDKLERANMERAWLRVSRRSKNCGMPAKS